MYAFSLTPRVSLEKPLPKNCQFIHVHQDGICVDDKNQLALFDKPLINSLNEHHAVHVANWHDRPIIAIELHSDEAQRHQLIPIKKYLSTLEPDQFQLICAARYSLTFLINNLYCGSCGQATCDSQNELAKLCLPCGRTIYPQYSPAVLIAIEKEHQILLARSPHFPAGMYSVLAGFIDPGESAEQTVTREANEEVGIKVTDIEYFGSQSWPFPTSYMIAFKANYLSGELQLQLDEIEDAKWFTPEELKQQLLPTSASLSRQLIDDFCRRQMKN